MFRSAKNENSPCFHISNNVRTRLKAAFSRRKFYSIKRQKSASSTLVNKRENKKRGNEIRLSKISDITEETFDIHGTGSFNTCTTNETDSMSKEAPLSMFKKKDMFRFAKKIETSPCSEAAFSQCKFYSIKGQKSASSTLVNKKGNKKQGNEISLSMLSDITEENFNMKADAGGSSNTCTPNKIGSMSLYLIDKAKKKMFKKLRISAKKDETGPSLASLDISNNNVQTRLEAIGSKSIFRLKSKKLSAQKIQNRPQPFTSVPKRHLSFISDITQESFCMCSGGNSNRKEEPVWLLGLGIDN
mmetsp:Transcript_10958/g.24131  ORF Transcript_10958/g.24131 Transcript_10958/m.24131 type:complete len:301 (-) Transcript_10958:172-1074(-)